MRKPAPRSEPRRRLHRGPFQPFLEHVLAREVVEFRRAHGALAPLRIVVPSRLLALHLQRSLPSQLPTKGHLNLRFRTLTDLARERSDHRAPSAPLLGQELLCRQLAQDPAVFPPAGYFAPVRATRGFAAALLRTFTDLKEAGLGPDTFRRAAHGAKQKELAAGYASFCGWLADHQMLTEADLLEAASRAPVPADEPPTFLYGFYDLNGVQRALVAALKPAAVFFPHAEAAPEFAQPLLDWFQGLGYAVCPRPAAKAPPSPQTDLVTAPGETAEVREAMREVLNRARQTAVAGHDIAVLYRSGEPYEARLRDTLRHLGIPAWFRSGEPLDRHPDAKLLLLLLEVLRSDYRRAAVMELACHLGPHTAWDVQSLQLGIVGGRAQWQQRVSRPGPLREFLDQLFALCAAIPAAGRWAQFVAAAQNAWRKLGGRYEPVARALAELEQLDPFAHRIDFETFANSCRQVLAEARVSTGRFQGGGIFVGDVMSARGLSWSMVVLLGLAEKSFPRVVQEDPLLLDQERQSIVARLARPAPRPKAPGAAADRTVLPRKQRGIEEEPWLFALACATARDRLVLSYPRLETTTARPRVPSHLLLLRTGVRDYEALEARARIVPLSPIRETEPCLEERELDWPLLARGWPEETVHPYLSEISAQLPAGVAAAHNRWTTLGLTRHDGWLTSKDALALLRERFVLEKLVISATALEDFFRCPFYYLQRHILHTRPWEEPEALVTADPADVGSLYHGILEEYYRQPAGADVNAVCEKHFRDFEERGVTGYPGVWALKKQVIREEVAAFVERDRRQAGEWVPAAFEQDFADVPVAPPVRLRGKIDRIDHHRDGRRARVLDYKTGRFSDRLRDDSFLGGESLQLALYCLAAERLDPARVVESARYLYMTLRGGYRSVGFSREALHARRAELDQLLETAAHMIRDGVFAQYAPIRPDPCRWCDYRPICSNAIHQLYQRKCGDAQAAAFHRVKEEGK